MSTQISQRDPRAQLGFDFADGFPIFRESPAGTWIEPKHTTAQYLAIFERCQHALPKARTMSNAAHRLFEVGLRGAMASHFEMLELGQGDGLYALWRGRNQPQGDDVTKFLQHCRRMIVGQWDSPGLDYQHRDASHHSATLIGALELRGTDRWHLRGGLVSHFGGFCRLRQCRRFSGEQLYTGVARRLACGR